MNELLARFPAVRLTPRAVTRLRVLVPVAGAVLFFVLWTAAEAGRSPHLLKEGMFLAWAIALGLSGVRPRIALAGTVLIPVLLLTAGIAYFRFSGIPYDSGYHLLLLPPTEFLFNLSTTWPAWFAAPIIVGYVALTGEAWRRRVAALVVGLVSATVYGVVLGVAGWLSWIGAGGNGYLGLFDDAATLALLLYLAVVVAWLLGLGLAALWRVEVVTTRLETATAKLDETDLELRLAHDRGRISRDIHDSLAHSLAIIVAQAEGAAAIHELRPELAPESLTNIATVAREALTEVRRLVERINDDDVSEHTSRLEHLPRLVDELRSIGVDATLRVLGDPGPLALSRQVAVFRIVQESLTNALKHGGRGSAVTVTLDAQGAGLAVLVVSKAGGGAPLVRGGGRGIGIPGMKERARLVGGWLTAVPSDDETFVVTAFIPPAFAAESDDPVGRRAADAERAVLARDETKTSDDIIDVESETGPFEIEGARG